MKRGNVEVPLLGAGCELPSIYAQCSRHPLQAQHETPYIPSARPLSPPQPAMPSLATASQRLTTVSSLILERSRVLSLGLTPSPTTDTKIARVLRQIRDELVQMPTGEGDDQWTRWEGLVRMMREDEMGRKQVAGLERPVPAPV